MKRQKQYNKTAQKYEDKLRKKGYFVKYNWTDPFGGFYEDVTVRGASSWCKVKRLWWRVFDT